MNQSIKRTIKCVISFIANLIPIKTRRSTIGARDTLNGFSSKPTGTCYTSNALNIQYDLQIIIPCYNVEKWVKRCLESVLKQRTKYNVLVSIVNDGSTDGTENVIREVIAEYHEHVVHCAAPGQCGYTIDLKTQENRGFSGARNTALKEIRGTYVTFLDADDVAVSGAASTADGGVNATGSISISSSVSNMDDTTTYSSIDTMLDAAFQSDAEI